MVNNLWPMLKEAVSSYIEHDALSRGAAIAFYAATALAPVLLILMAIVGLVLGEQAAREALTYQFQELMGKQSAELVQSIIKDAGRN